MYITNTKISQSEAVQRPTRNPIFDRQKHPFHILQPSVFPFFTGFFLFFLLVPTTFYMHGAPLPLFPRTALIHISFLGLFVIVMEWFVAIVRESRQGFHTKKVQYGLRLGMLLFIVSEVMLFFAFFWAFFHFSLIPSTAIGAVWPPTGTQPLSAWGLPLVNTLLLLSSGVTITAAHAYIVKDDMMQFGWYLFLTILLGITFLFCQAYEYKYGVKFSWRDNIYGSIFFITTGFHGLHVTIGTLFLAFCWVRHFLTMELPIRCVFHNQLIPLVKFLNRFGYTGTLRTARMWGFSANHHFGFEAAAWYWHFVDVVWLFLFLTIYWWGGV